MPFQRNHTRTARLADLKFQAKHFQWGIKQPQSTFIACSRKETSCSKQEHLAATASSIQGLCMCLLIVFLKTHLSSDRSHPWPLCMHMGFLLHTPLYCWNAYLWHLVFAGCYLQLLRKQWCCPGHLGKHVCDADFRSSAAWVLVSSWSLPSMRRTGGLMLQIKIWHDCRPRKQQGLNPLLV